MDDGQADHRCHLIAVTIELFERLHAARLEIGEHTRDHFPQVSMWNSEAPDSMMECRPERVAAKTSFERIFHLGAPALDRRAGSPRLIAEIGRASCRERV